MWRFLRNRRLSLRLRTIVRALIYWAHRAVIFAIAWLLVRFCNSTCNCIRLTVYVSKTTDAVAVVFVTGFCLTVWEWCLWSLNWEQSRFCNHVVQSVGSGDCCLFYRFEQWKLSHYNGQIKVKAKFVNVTLSLIYLVWVFEYAKLYN